MPVFANSYQTNIFSSFQLLFFPSWEKRSRIILYFALGGELRLVSETFQVFVVRSLKRVVSVTISLGRGGGNAAAQGEPERVWDLVTVLERFL